MWCRGRVGARDSVASIGVGAGDGRGVRAFDGEDTGGGPWGRWNVGGGGGGGEVRGRSVGLAVGESTMAPNLQTICPQQQQQQPFPFHIQTNLSSISIGI